MPTMAVRLVRKLRGIAMGLRGLRGVRRHPVLAVQLAQGGTSHGADGKHEQEPPPMRSAPPCVAKRWACLAQRRCNAASSGFRPLPKRPMVSR